MNGKRPGLCNGHQGVQSPGRSQHRLSLAGERGQIVECRLRIAAHRLWAASLLRPSFSPGAPHRGATCGCAWAASLVMVGPNDA
jgi:hypothetical protein